MQKNLLFLSCFIILMSCEKSSPPDDSIPYEIIAAGSPGDDPLANQAWHLKNTGQTSYSRQGGMPGEDHGIFEVHELGLTGAGVRIAVSDSGVDVGHSDLADNQLSGEHRDYSSNNSSYWRNASPHPKELDAHGTSVTGLIAALGWNGIGSRGVAPEAKFAGFYFLGNYSSTQSSYEAKTIDQIDGDFDVFNYSYGYAGCRFTPTSRAVVQTYRYGVNQLRQGLGAIYVKAAGNDFIGYNSDCRSGDQSYFLGNSNTSEDQNLPYLILTAALNAEGKVASYSTPGSGLWISGAGGEFGTNSPAMVTTDIGGCQDGFSRSSSGSNDFNRGATAVNRNCDYTNVMNGTSSASPVIAGIVALMLEANPRLSWRDVKHILAVTADKVRYSTKELKHPIASLALENHVYDELYVNNAAGYAFSNTYGFGRANALKAIQLAKDYSFPLGPYAETENPDGSWPYDSGRIDRAIPDRSAQGTSAEMTVTHDYRIESVQIRVTTDHPYVGDLGVELTSPAGTKSRLLLVNNNINHSQLSDFTFLSNAFYGESSGGRWVIRVIDGAITDVGRLNRWKLKINGSPLSGGN